MVVLNESSMGIQKNMMPMELLHIRNTAGIASILTKFMDRELSTQSWVITRQASDSWGLTVFGEALNLGSYRFVFNVLRRIYF